MTRLKDIDSDLRGGDSPPQAPGVRVALVLQKVFQSPLCSQMGSWGDWPQAIRRQCSRVDTEYDLATC